MTISLTNKTEIILAKLSKYFQENYKRLIQNPKLFWMRKLSRFEIVREWISNLSKQQVTSYEVGEANTSVFQGINIDEAVSCLNKDSLYLGLNLPENVIQEVMEFAESTTCYGDRNPELSFYYRDKEKIEAQLGRKFRLGSYLHNLDNCSTVKKLEKDPVLLALAAKFLEAEPVHVATELWWSFPVTATPFEQLQAAQVFHYDVDDYRFIKFFFYLTEVDLSSGPHICIRGTHKNKKFYHQLIGARCASLADEKIVECYGAENLVTICGSAGLGFAEDSFCFHKGTLPTGKERLLLQIEYSVNNYGNIRKF